MDNQFQGVFTIGQTLDRGFRLYKKTLKNLLILWIVPSLLSLLQMLNQPDLANNPGSAGTYVLLMVINM